MASTSIAPSDAPRRGYRPGPAMFIIGLAQLIVVLDATIVSVALPTIQRALHFSTEDLSWVVNGYTLTFGGFLLLGGRAGDILGRRRMFAYGILLFTAASLAGGLATSSAWLLAARAVQGVGAAVVSPAVLALIATNFPDEKTRNKAFGVFAGVSGAGAAVGLLAGGLLTQWVSWRWILFVNVPIGALLLFLTPLYIAGSPRQPGRFDLAGAVTSTLGMGSLVYAFVSASQNGWSDPTTLTCFGAAFVLLAAFVVVEARTAQPITPLHMFADRNRASIYVVAFCVTGSLMGLFFFLTLFLQNILRYDPVEAGLAFLPVSVGVIVTAGAASQLLPRTGAKPLLVLGTLLNSVAFAWLAQLSAGSSYLSGLFGPLMLFGIGTGLLFVPLTMLGVSGVAPEESGAASSLLNATQQIGGALGLAILVSVFSAAQRHEVRQGVTDPGSVLVNGMSTTFLVTMAMSLLALVVGAVAVRAGRPTAEDVSALMRGPLAGQEGVSGQGAHTVTLPGDQAAAEPRR